MGIIIVDIDGVVAEPQAVRLELLKQRPVDWDLFYQMDFSQDSPLYDTMLFIKRLYEKSKSKLIFITSRSIEVQKDTLKWLTRYFNPMHYEWDLLMREYEDRRPDYLVKQSLYLEFLDSEEVLCAIDDNPNVIKMWQGLGLATIEVTKEGTINE